MTIIRSVLIAGLLLSAVAAAAQSPQPLYSESFKKGPTRISERTLEIILTPQNGQQEFPINDNTGKPRYTLRFVPDIAPGDTKVLGWFVRLADRHHKIYDSVLPTSPDLSQDSAQLWWLDACRFAKAPLQAERIFKVEQFYCVVQVKDVKRLLPDQPYLNQMNVSVQFTNTKP